MREGHGCRGWEGATCQSRQERASPEQGTLLGLRHPLPSRLSALTRLVRTLLPPRPFPSAAVAGLLCRRLSRGLVRDSLARLGAGACRALHPTLSSAGQTDLSPAPVMLLRRELRLPAPEKAAQLRLPLAQPCWACRVHAAAALPLCSQRGGSFPFQVGLALSRPGQGGWDPLAPPVGGQLNQDLPPALGLPPFYGTLAGAWTQFPFALLPEPALDSARGWAFAQVTALTLSCLGAQLILESGNAPRPRALASPSCPSPSRCGHPRPAQWGLDF